MPDEQAFTALVHLMNTYQFRGLFTPKMELLQLRLYQFDRLLVELMPRVHDHLISEGIRSTMYASQWLMTLFAYRFPLDFVFRVLDVIFAIGVVPGASGMESVMDTMIERMSEVTGAQSKLPLDMSTETATVFFRFAFALMKKNEEMLLALEFEPLLEFLKHGLFLAYTEEMTSTDHHHHGLNNSSTRQTSDASTRRPTPTPSSRMKTMSAAALDGLVHDAMSSQLKAIHRKRLWQLKKDFDEELRHSDPLLLAEKSLEATNSRLQSDLRRAEKMMAELNRDHCDLAGQLVTIRIDLCREREQNHLLTRQVSELKRVLATDLSHLNGESVAALGVDLNLLLKFDGADEQKMMTDENERLRKEVAELQRRKTLNSWHLTQLLNHPSGREDSTTFPL